MTTAYLGVRFWLRPLSIALLALSVVAPVAGQDNAVNPPKQNTDSSGQETDAAKPNKAAKPGWEKRLDAWAETNLLKPMLKVLFFDFWTGPTKDDDGNVTSEGWLGTSVPFVVVWLMFGALFLTIRMGFINLRGFGHALRVTKGDYDDPEDTGEVTHFQALTSALSATVGLGNIAGVAIAVGTGGPGAIVWMIFAGVFGMTSKFVECTLAQMYRRVGPDGVVSGGPMRYLHDGLREMGLGPLGAVLAVVFTVLCIGGSVGGGCAFQVVQSKELLATKFEFLDSYGWVYGIIMVAMVGIVIIGGIRRIAAAAEKIVPAMCVIYVLTALLILGLEYDKIGWAIGVIVSEAFTLKSAFGGLLGVMVIGIKRAAFSNEAGIGSAAIAHSAAKTEYPVREGIVALMGPFIDTVLICTMTGLVIVITQAYDTSIYPAHQVLIDGDKGAVLTSNAFASVVTWFPYILCVAATLFAYSTMISWSYYGERCFTYLFGVRSSMIYRVGFLGFVFLGSIMSAKSILVFSDLMILSMAFPNILGLLLLSGKVRRALSTYWSQFKAGEFKTHKELAAAGSD